MTSLLTTAVQGSRHPFTVSADKLAQNHELREGTHAHTTGTVPFPVSKSRRKQLRTYQSPAAGGDAELRMESVAIPRVAKATTLAATESNSVVSEEEVHAEFNTKHVYPAEPPLPLYHPKGQLALSLPELDPAIFGLASNAINIDDHDIRGHLQDSDPRRSSSRARRPAAKLRDVVGGDEEEANDVVNAANGKKAADASGQARSTSPRKRRTAGSGAAGGGGKRRRKDADDADGTYPNPAHRRTRNARGAAAAAVASPLAGPAVVADAEPDEGDGEGDADADDAATVAGEPAEPSGRATRSRRSRAAAPKRRGSSASETTTTSVSVSIAANARTTRSGGAKRPSDDDMPGDADEATLPQPAANKDEDDNVDDTLSSPKEDINTAGDGSPEKNDMPVRPAVANNSAGSKELVDTAVEKTTLVSAGSETEPRREENTLDCTDTQMITQDTASPVQSSAKLAEESEDNLTEEPSAETASKMDVDSPGDAVQLPAPKQNDQDPAPPQSFNPRSPSPLAPSQALAPERTSPAVRSNPPKLVPEVASVSVRLDTQTPAVSKPASAKPQDDEKEEGELSDE